MSQPWPLVLFIYFFKRNSLFKKHVYVPTTGCPGSSLPCAGFSSCGKLGLFSSCGAPASRCSGFSCCGACALGLTGSSSCRSGAPGHGLNSCGHENKQGIFLFLALQWICIKNRWWCSKPYCTQKCLMRLTPEVASEKACRGSISSMAPLLSRGCVWPTLQEVFL